MTVWCNGEGYWCTARGIAMLLGDICEQPGNYWDDTSGY